MKYTKSDKIDWQKRFSLYCKFTELQALYGLIIATPAKEFKKMKLRQVKKELEELVANKEHFR